MPDPACKLTTFALTMAPPAVFVTVVPVPATTGIAARVFVIVNAVPFCTILIPSPAVSVGKLPVLVTVKLPDEPEMLIPDPAARLLTPVFVIVEYRPAVVISMPAPACRVPPPEP